MGRAETWNQPFLAFTALASVMAKGLVGVARVSGEGDALARAERAGNVVAVALGDPAEELEDPEVQGQVRAVDVGVHVDVGVGGGAGEAVLLPARPGAHADDGLAAAAEARADAPLEVGDARPVAGAEVHRGGRRDPVVGGGVVLGIERRAGDGDGDAVLGREIPADLDHGGAAVLEAGVLEERVRHVGEADRAQRGDEPVVLADAERELRLRAPGRVGVGLPEPDGRVVEAGRRGRHRAGVATVEVDLDERRERGAGPAGRVVEGEARHRGGSGARRRGRCPRSRRRVSQRLGSG